GRAEQPRGARRHEAEPLEEHALRRFAVADHELVPARIERIPEMADRPDPADAADRRAAEPGEARRRAALDPLRRDRGGRIDADPAAILEPDLRPRVRVGLPHDVEVAELVQLAAVIAGHDASRHAGRAWHDRERGRVVRAEALAGLEQELVDGAYAEARRRQRVAERLPAKVVERGPNQRFAAEALRLPAGDERDGAGARAVRQMRQ